MLHHYASHSTVEATAAPLPLPEDVPKAEDALARPYTSLVGGECSVRDAAEHSL